MGAAVALDLSGGGLSWQAALISAVRWVVVNLISALRRLSLVIKASPHRRDG